MVVGRFMRHGDLIARAESQAYPFMNWNSSDQQARGEEDLVEAGTLAVGPPGMIHLKFGPEVPEDAVLKSGIPRHRHSQAILTAVRKCNSQCALDVEVAPAFAGRNGWREDKMTAAVGGVPGGRAKTQKQSHDVVAVLFIGREQTILQQKGLIRPAVARRDLLFRSVNLLTVVRNP